MVVSYDAVYFSVSLKPGDILSNFICNVESWPIVHVQFPSTWSLNSNEQQFSKLKHELSERKILIKTDCQDTHETGNEFKEIFIEAAYIAEIRRIENLTSTFSELAIVWDTNILQNKHEMYTDGNFLRMPSRAAMRDVTLQVENREGHRRMFRKCCSRFFPGGL